MLYRNARCDDLRQSTFVRPLCHCVVHSCAGFLPFLSFHTNSCAPAISPLHTHASLPHSSLPPPIQTDATHSSQRIQRAPQGERDRSRSTDDTASRPTRSCTQRLGTSCVSSHRRGGPACRNLLAWTSAVYWGPKQCLLARSGRD